jgi:Tfp pilus assembly protein PilF
VGAELAVGKLVTGSAQVVGSRLRVTAQLVNVEDGTSMWSEQYSGNLSTIFAMQDSIAASVVEALRIRLAGPAHALVGRGARTQDLGAYELYLRARRATYELTLAGNERAITLLQQALARDSTFADAWVALADAYAFYAQFGGLPPAEVTARWRRAVERAIQLDTLNGLAFAIRGALRMQYDWDWDGAWNDLRRAVRLSPASADAALNYAQFLNWVDAPDSALAQMRRAVALDPANSFLIANLAWRFAFAQMPDSARATAERALAMDSTQWVASFLLARLSVASGRRAEAEREVAQMLRYTGEELPVALAWAASIYGMADRPDRAREMLRRLERLGRRQYVQATYIAQARLAAGDRAGAITALEEAARNHDLDLTWDLAMWYSALNGETRYEVVRRKVFGGRPAPRGWPHTSQ